MTALLRKIRNNAEKISSRGDKVSYISTYNRLIEEAIKKDVDIEKSSLSVAFEPLIKDVTCRVLVKALSIASQAFGFIDHMSRDIQRNKDLLSLSLNVHSNVYGEILANMKTAKRKSANPDMDVKEMIDECAALFEIHNDEIISDLFEPFVFLTKLKGSETRVIYTKKGNSRLVIVFYQRGSHLDPLCYFVYHNGYPCFINLIHQYSAPEPRVQKNVFKQVNTLDLSDWFKSIIEQKTKFDFLPCYLA
ncbi:hypothetical protein TVAG_390590 [Trichomonas vaginalis G3]|uniref:Uncharacterized protein n=1 Tax=Trichomonas vaginalis (strain ATCC PRA-98 / G3) TaxID=412133 RepID=A2ESW3_TRIV3|nr:hypothetical protein TVAGG3_0182220 [Trichomonas vaginalis G3]EAY04289.1 hypothetical protein TVAG_390590 [Trichomonas vaginalis G3]KAI5549382.1 hypothetical protein TVAGG3_0182220 [Trichomonas vaginalis G3]|eukprot:XP_001316512.1 hypothetical protein [Trichomonas vaginalis G3]